MEGRNLIPPRNENSRQTSRKIQSPNSKSRPWRHRLPICLAAVGLAVVSLACAIFGPTTDDVVIRIQLPTLTRTPLPTLTPTTTAAQAAVVMTFEPTIADIDPSTADSTTVDEASTNSPVAAPATLTNNVSVPTDPNASPQQQPQTGAALANAPPSAAETPTPTATATEELPPTPTETALPTSTPTLTPTPLPAGWIFTDMRLGPAPDGRDLLIAGILINNTGTPQILDTIDGLFYDNQGQSIANTFYTLDYPINEVPQGGRIPFQIQLKDHPNAADFDLQVLAESGGDSPRQDFEFLEVNAVPQGDEYCVAGRVRNPGSELGSYLLVAAVLYDSENKVINYDYNYFDESLPTLTGERTQEVSLCVNPLQQQVVRTELVAWGM